MERHDSYQAPEITVLGDVTDMTQKHGILYDYPHGSSDVIDIKLDADIDILGLSIKVS